MLYDNPTCFTGLGALIRSDWLSQGDEGTSVGATTGDAGQPITGTATYPYRGRILLPSFPANSQFLEPPVTFHAVQDPEDCWVHPHGNRDRVDRFDFVTYCVNQRFPSSSYAEYNQSPSSSGDDQPPSPQQQVQETIPKWLIRTRRPRQANLESALLEPFSPPSAHAASPCVCFRSTSSFPE
ncbi:hypothetical protein Efla_002667 [Eimeria flavescens]